MERSDEELIRAVASGSHAAMGELIRRYELPLGRYILRHCTPCSPYRDDILQDAFVKVFRNVHDFDPKLKFSTWAYRITHNAMIDHVRRVSLRAGRMEHYEEGVGDADAKGNLFSSSSFRPEAGVEKREFEALVQSAMTAMNDNLRAVFILRFLEEKEYGEIGDILKQNANTVATWVRRAREIFVRESRRAGIEIKLEATDGSR